MLGSGDAEDPSKRAATLEVLRPWIAGVGRPAWRPIVEPGEPEAGRSKFAGAPHLMPGEGVPSCRLCARELQLLAQLDLDDLPGEARGQYGSGVLQLFYCVGPDRGVHDDGHVECFADEGWEPFSDKASLVRVVPRPGLTVHPLGGRLGFSAVAVVGWEGFVDLPHPEDHEELGLVADYDFEEELVTLRVPWVGLEATLGIDELPVEEIAIAAEGDKLGGWPYWVQAQEYPACPTCGARMRVVLQLDSEHNVPFMFGDAGVGHITQCPTHHDMVAFGWACG